MLFSQDDKMRIMVLDFGGSGVEASLLIAAYEDLETKLIETNRFIVIDRSTRESRMSELKYQRSGCVTDECIIEIGRELSANYVVNGSINKIGKSFQINIKLVDMEQGEMTEKVTERVKGGEEELFDGIEKLSLELVRRIVSASGGGASAPVQSMSESTVTLAYGIIEVATTPSNANIVIDGQEVGLSPVRKENIVTGQHRIVIVLPGYETITKIVNVVEGKSSNVDEILAPQTGGLTLISDPIGAKVFLDGQLKGNAPMSISELPTKDYMVKLTLDHYEETTTRITIEYKQELNRRITLKPLDGLLTVRTSPTNVDFVINKEKYNSGNSGLKIVPIQVGKHPLRFLKKGYEDASQTINISPEEEKFLEIQMYLSKTEEKSDDSYVNNKPYKNRDETWFGLERGWVRDENEGGDLPNEGGDLPNYECNIIHETTGTTFTLINPSQNIYNFGDTYTVTLYSDTYSVGQQGGAILCLNENTVYNFGSWLVFDSNGQRDFTLPSESENIYPSNCYTIVMIGYNQQDEYVSEPITIY